MGFSAVDEGDSLRSGLACLPQDYYQPHKEVSENFPKGIWNQDLNKNIPPTPWSSLSLSHSPHPQVITSLTKPKLTKAGVGAFSAYLKKSLGSESHAHWTTSFTEVLAFKVSNTSFGLHPEES